MNAAGLPTLAAFDPGLDSDAVFDERRAPLAAAGEQPRRLEQWQTDDVRIGARDKADHCRGAALNRIAAGLAVPFAGRQISRDFARAQALERDLAVDVAQPHTPVGICQRNAGMDTMSSPGQQFETAARARFVHRLGEDATAAGDDRVGGEDVVAGMARHYRAQLLLGETQCMSSRLLLAVGRLVDL